VSAASHSSRRVILGLAWEELFVQNRFFQLAIMQVILLATFYGVVAQPFGGLHLTLGVVLAMLFGIGVGGAHRREGIEELVLSLPPTRRSRYLVRASIALVGLVISFALAVGSGLAELLPSLPGESGSLADLVTWELNTVQAPWGPALIAGLVLLAFVDLFGHASSTLEPGSFALAPRMVLTGCACFVAAALIELAGGALVPALATFAVAALIGLRFARGLRAYERMDAVAFVVDPAELERRTSNELVLSLFTGLAIVGGTAALIYLAR